MKKHYFPSPTDEAKMISSRSHATSVAESKDILYGAFYLRGSIL